MTEIVPGTNLVEKWEKTDYSIPDKNNQPFPQVYNCLPGEENREIFISPDSKI